MDTFISCFHAGDVHPQQPQHLASPTYCYIPGQYWQTLDYYDVGMDIDPNLTEAIETPSAFKVHENNSFNTMTINSAQSLTQNNSPGTEQGQDFSQASPATELESVAHSPRSRGHQHSCDVCERDKRERRKEQNRKAQRNHRLRSEAKLDQLRVKVQSQTEEIISLKEANRSLLKQLDMLRGIGRGKKDGGTTNANTGLPRPDSGPGPGSLQQRDDVRTCSRNAAVGPNPKVRQQHQ